MYVAKVGTVLPWGFILQLVKMLNSSLGFYLFMFLQNSEGYTFIHGYKKTKVYKKVYLTTYIPM